MPRLARLDAPGVLHHIMIRGIERRAIFKDNKDRDDFIERLSTLLPQTHTACYAWAFMPNHAHFLLRTGKAGISTVMRRLLTGYAVGFNHRHKRHGQLFQNRYKSIICQEDLYLQELVRYIHLNPLRRRLVSGIAELNRYPYCGHSALMGRKKRGWQDTEDVLRAFGETLRDGRRRYSSYVRAGAAQGRREDLVGGGLIRSLGGWAEIKRMRLKGRSRVKGDERILGGTDFVMQVLAGANEKFDRHYELKSLGYDLQKVADRVSALYEIEPKEVFSKGRQKHRVEARSLLCYWAVRELAVSLTGLARVLSMTPSAISYAVVRGEALAKHNNYHLIE